MVELRAFALVTMALLAACNASGGGDGGTTFSCEQKQVGAIVQCREVTPGDRAMLMSECAASSSGATFDGGTGIDTAFVDGPCPRAGLVGGCRRPYHGGTETNWYYAGYPAGALALLCSDGTVVDP